MTTPTATATATVTAPPTQAPLPTMPAPAKPIPKPGATVAKLATLYGKKAKLRVVQYAAATHGYEVSLQAQGRKIDPGLLHDTLEAIDPTLGGLVTQPKGAHAALRAAVRRCQRGVPEGLEWREVETVGTRLCIALAKRDARVGSTVSQTWLATESEAAVEVDEATGSFATSLGAHPEHAPVVAKLREVYDEERGTLDCTLLWELVGRVARQTGGGCIAINTGSLLVQNTDGLEKLQAAFDTAWEQATKARRMNVSGSAPILYGRYVSYDAPATNTGLAGGMSRVVEASLIDKLDEIEKEMEEKIKASEKNGRAVRVDTAEAFVGKLATLRGETTLLAKCLGKAAQRLLARADEIEKWGDDAVKGSWEKADAEKAKK